MRTQGSGELLRRPRSVNVIAGVFGRNPRVSLEGRLGFSHHLPASQISLSGGGRPATFGFLARMETAGKMPGGSPFTVAGAPRGRCEAIGDIGATKFSTFDTRSSTRDRRGRRRLNFDLNLINSSLVPYILVSLPLSGQRGGGEPAPHFTMSNHYDKNLSESRKSDAEQQRQKKLVLVGSSAALLLLLVVGAVATSNYQNDESDSNISTKTMHSSSKSVKMLCSATDYTHACEVSLSKAVKSDTDDPKILLKAAVTVVLDEVSKGFAHSKLLQSNDSRVRGAVEDCQAMYENSKIEINATIQTIIDHGIDNLPHRSHDMRTWLSAVMAYQETCIDGFPEGELKTKMRHAMTGAKELTSNALAIIGQASSFLSLINPSRRLLSAEEELALSAPKKNGFPSWVSKSDRRMLRGARHRPNLAFPPNVTVAKDGSGDFTTINQAMDAIPKNRNRTIRYVIYVKQGIYDEQVNFTRNYENILMYGDGATKSIITGNHNNVDGTRTFHTPPFVVAANGFVGIAMGFRNTAGPAKHQAVAARVQADSVVFLNCRFEAYQDTLYAHSHRQFYRGCVITGTVDFIFGDGTAVFQNCLLVVRRPLDNQQNIITAQGRTDHRETSGFVFQNCRIKADKRLLDTSRPPIRSYLARPWKSYSKTIFMESHIEDFIDPAGYLPWDGDFGLNTLYYAEFNNYGPGANGTARVKWPGFHVIGKQEAMRYTVESFIQGSSWIRESGTPVRLGLSSA
ncbi:hypothetical protein Cni_G11388 [Canna indica]|uniref:pectinesterase n=1 Tax=Canna indica TaxID=4628 RepID=A0AAQ3Q9H7_9LILI|nr:hypothetical protein Cni_G11388 [Canna indica]